MRFKNFKVQYELDNGKTYKEFGTASADHVNDLKIMLKEGIEGVVQCQISRDTAVAFSIKRVVTFQFQGIEKV